MTDTRFSWAVIMDLLDVLERAGYKRGDDIHTGRAIALLSDAARIYAGELDQPEAVPATPLVVRGLAKAEAARAVVPADETTAAARLAEIRVVLGAFDWSTDDRQYALGQVEQIVNGAALPAGTDAGQAAFEAYERAASGDPGYRPYPWQDVDPRGRRNWDAAAQAAIVAHGTAAAAPLAEIRAVLESSGWQASPLDIFALKDAAADWQCALEQIDGIVTGRPLAPSVMCAACVQSAHTRRPDETGCQCPCHGSQS